MQNLVQTSSPHIHCGASARRVMLDVILALAPACVAAVVLFGVQALWILCVCVASAVLAEALFDVITGKKQTIGDLSAVVTGILLALNLSTNVPLWQCALGSVFAIVVVKCLFGGLGYNFANPAITARVFLLVAFASTVAGGANPTVVELAASATPLEVLAHDGVSAAPSLLNMLLGVHGGTIGETCILALVLGYAYLVWRKVIKWYVPFSFVATVFVCFLIASGSFQMALYEILAGGLFLGAIFMATDYVTTPITSSGRVVFGIGCGLITFIIRQFCGYPEGVSFSILAMNILTPAIEKVTEHWPLGGAWGGRKKRQIVKPALTLAVLAVVFVLALSGLNLVTAPMIEKNAASQQTGMLYNVMPDATGFDLLYSQSVADESALKDVPETVKGIYAESAGNGYALLLSTTKGYTGDPIEFTLAVDKEGKIIGTEVTNYPESKDFGADYPSTYVGQDSTLSGVSLVAGVTYSSSAFKNAVADGFAALSANGLVAEAVKSDEQLMDELLPTVYPGIANASGIVQADEISGSFTYIQRALAAKNESGIAAFARNGDANYLAVCNTSGFCKVYTPAGEDVTAQQADIVAEVQALENQTFPTPEKVSKKLRKMVADDAEFTPVLVDTFNSVTEAYSVQSEGKQYFGFVTETYSYNNETTTGYFMLDENGAIAGMNASPLFFEEDYFAVSKEVDKDAYKAGLMGLTVDTFTGEQALVAGATFTTGAIRTAANDVFATFQWIQANGGK